jgi:hypothetical protein
MRVLCFSYVKQLSLQNGRVSCELKTCSRFRIAMTPPGGSPGGLSLNLTVLKFIVQIRLEQLILVHRVDGEVAESAGPNGVVDLPRIRPREVEGHGIS